MSVRFVDNTKQTSPQREELPSGQVVQEETAETASQRLQDRRRGRLHICHHQNGPAPRPEAQDGEKFRRFQAEAGTVDPL